MFGGVVRGRGGEFTLSALMRFLALTTVTLRTPWGAGGVCTRWAIWAEGGSPASKGAAHLVTREILAEIHSKSFRPDQILPNGLSAVVVT